MVDTFTLAELLADVGLNATEDDIARIVLDFDKTVKDKFTFIEFAKAIYIMKQLEIPAGTEDDVIDFENDKHDISNLSALTMK